MDQDVLNNYFDILNSNEGFSDPTIWVEYARQHDFKKVDAVYIPRCPGCRSDRTIKLGQYIYYSNLINIKICKVCDLIYSDVRLNDQIIKEHFERAYKDEDYFARNRMKIFLQVVGLVRKDISYGGRIIDIGGAKGHQALIIRKYRPDLKITINDLSETACNEASSMYGFETICGKLSNVLRREETFDYALLIDVLYYEENIEEAWQTISALINKGSVLLRLPNKIWLIRVIMYIKQILLTKKKLELVDRVDFFNPEHMFIFSRKYIMRQSKRHGFNKATFMPSKFMISSIKFINIFSNIYYCFALIVYYLSLKKVILTTSQLVLLKKYGSTSS